MGFENFGGQTNKQGEENPSEFEINVCHIEALMEMHSGDASEVTKTVMLWVDEAKKRYDRKH